MSADSSEPSSQSDLEQYNPQPNLAPKPSRPSHSPAVAANGLKAAGLGLLSLSLLPGCHPANIASGHIQEPNNLPEVPTLVPTRIPSLPRKPRSSQYFPQGCSPAERERASYIINFFNQPISLDDASEDNIAIYKIAAAGHDYTRTGRLFYLLKANTIGVDQTIKHVATSQPGGYDIVHILTQDSTGNLHVRGMIGESGVFDAKSVELNGYYPGEDWYTWYYYISEGYQANRPHRLEANWIEGKPGTISYNGIKVTYLNIGMPLCLEPTPLPGTRRV